MNSMFCGPINNTKQSILYFTFSTLWKDLTQPVLYANMSPVHGGPCHPEGLSTASWRPHHWTTSQQIQTWFLDILKPWQQQQKIILWNRTFGENWNICNFLNVLFTSETILWTQEDNTEMCIIWFPYKVRYFLRLKELNMFL